MAKSPRSELIARLTRATKSTGQLFIKCLASSLLKNKHYNPANMPILKALKERAPRSQHDIAKELNYTDASISRQIKLLVAKGMISASPDPKNRRRAIIDLTPKGKQALNQIEAAVIGRMEELLSGMPDRKIKLATSALNDLHRTITNHLSEKGK